MDAKKAVVVKSHSVNTPMPDKFEYKHYRNISSDNSPCHKTGLKKRGFYVEKKSSIKVWLNQQDASRNTSDKTRRPKSVHRKYFIQCTTSTQYPECYGKNAEKLSSTCRSTPGVTRYRKQLHKSQTSDRGVQNDEESLKKPYNAHRKYIDRIEETFVVLKPAKPILQTPSDHSQVVNMAHFKQQLEDLFSAENKPKNQKQNSIKEKKRVTLRHQPSERKEEITEISNEEPDTLVSQVGRNRKDKVLYTFFKDVIETTFDVCKEDKSGKVIQCENSETCLEAYDIPDNKSNSCATACKYDIRDISEPLKFVSRRHGLDSRSIIPAVPPCNRRKKGFHIVCSVTTLKSNNLKGKKKKSTEIRSFTVLNSKKQKCKKSKKATFLDMLKQELSLQFNGYQEPKNFHDALRIMARNKRQCRAISFDDNIDVYDREDVNKGNRQKPECMLQKKVFKYPKRFQKKKPKRVQNFDYTPIGRPPAKRVRTQFCEPPKSNFKLIRTGMNKDLSEEASDNAIPVPESINSSELSVKVENYFFKPLKQSNRKVFLTKHDGPPLNEDDGPSGDSSIFSMDYEQL